MQAVKPRGRRQRPLSVKHEGQMDDDEYTTHVKTATARRVRELRARQGEVALVQQEEKEAKEREAASVRAEKKAKAEELRLRREANIRRKEEERERALVERARALQAREVPSACKPNWLPPPPPSVDEQQATGVRINRRRSSAGPPLQTIKSLAVGLIGSPQDIQRSFQLV